MANFKTIMNDLHISKGRVYQIINSLPDDKKPTKLGTRYQFTDESVKAIEEYYTKTTKPTSHKKADSIATVKSSKALLDQLDKKDQQIKELNERLSEANKNLEDASQTLKQAQQVSLTAMENNKATLAQLAEAKQTIQELRALSEPQKNESDSVKNVNVDKSTQTNKTAEKSSESASSTPKKESWWHRLFK